jgi:hypothetical protein
MGPTTRVQKLSRRLLRSSRHSLSVCLKALIRRCDIGFAFSLQNEPGIFRLFSALRNSVVSPGRPISEKMFKGKPLSDNLAKLTGHQWFRPHFFLAYRAPVKLSL